MTEIIMPKMGLNMSEGQIVEWLAKAGDEVAQGQEIVSIESEKVVNNVEAETSGFLQITVPAGETVPVGSIIGYLFEPGEDAPKQASLAGGLGAKPRSAEVTSAGSPASKPTSHVGGEVQSGTRISPAARRKAQALGVDLNRISGTGPGGRITIEDVEKAPSGDAARAQDSSSLEDTPSGSGRRIPFAGVRKAIAEAMTASQQSSAAVTLTTEVDSTRIVDYRSSFAKKEGMKVSYNAILLQVVAAALKQFPYMNARLEGEAIVMMEKINVGLAMDAEQGLVVPVVREADRLTLKQIQQRIQQLIEEIHTRTATPDEFHGGTFTVTNLGAYGIDAFTPIINPGQTAILGVGRISQRAVVRGGRVEIRFMCVLSLTFDHRLVDGVPAAKFLSALKDSVESYS